MKRPDKVIPPPKYPRLPEDFFACCHCGGAIDKTKLGKAIFKMNAHNNILMDEMLNLSKTMKEKGNPLALYVEYLANKIVLLNRIKRKTQNKTDQSRQVVTLDKIDAKLDKLIMEQRKK